ncbi:poly-beta-1,6-N-acetyl-D-glucosamine biosynthesis protein PgaD [Neisseriaceae bacterium JH1-16]|nr:poly-beta-1,6-N-acetyl-D-glucosamine biosynthesis protein PgaD [Neisseriaceae bacterium JH1-16]
MNAIQDDLIIHAEHNLTWAQRLISMSLTSLLWLFWMYLWMPLISLIGWLFGVEFFYDEMVLREGWYGLLELLLIYALVVAVISGMLLLWACVNYYRFRGRERRKAIPSLPLAEQAGDFSVSTSAVATGQASRIVVVHHDQYGMITAIEPCKVPV